LTKRETLLNYTPMINVNILRGTIIALLDNDEGISSDGYDSLRGLVSSMGKVGAQTVDEQCGDIWAAVDAADGRFFLSEGHGLQ